MKLPLTPPSLDEVLAHLEPALFRRIYAASTPTVDGSYLHWDQLRHRSPPEGMTSESWWAAVKLARGGMLQALPLLDRTGKPFLIATPEDVLIHLHHIDKDAAGHIQSAADVTTPENRNRYLFQSMVEEAITSSQLEGAATTRQVAEDMLREGRKPRDHSESMIFNNFQAMELIRKIRHEPITPNRILELHRILTEGTLDDPADAGRLRRGHRAAVTDLPP